jgi:hypothetical protein
MSVCVKVRFNRSSVMKTWVELYVLSGLSVKLWVDGALRKKL